MTGAPFPDGEIFGEHQVRPKPKKRQTPFSPGADRVSRRLGVLAAALSLAVFLIAMFVLTATVYRDGMVCGSPLGQANHHDACADALQGRWGMALILAFASIGLAVLAARLRWRPQGAEYL